MNSMKTTLLYSTCLLISLSFSLTRGSEEFLSRGERLQLLKEGRSFFETYKENFSGLKSMNWVQFNDLVGKCFFPKSFEKCEKPELKEDMGKLLVLLLHKTEINKNISNNAFLPAPLKCQGGKKPCHLEDQAKDFFNGSLDNLRKSSKFPALNEKDKRCDKQKNHCKELSLQDILLNSRYKTSSSQAE